MAVNIAGGESSVNKVNVSSNYQMEVVTPRQITQAGFVLSASQVDEGTVLGTPTARAIEVSDDYRLRTGVDSSLFIYSFESVNYPGHHFTQNTSTFTVAGGSNYWILNQGSSTSSSAYAQIVTKRTFPLFGSYPLYVDFWLREANEDATGAISEWGIGYVPVSTATVTDGVFFRRNDAGQLKAVASYGGIETEVTINTINVLARDSGSFSAQECNHYYIVLHNDVASFWINDVMVAKIPCPDNQPALNTASSAPVFCRVRTPVTTSSTARRLEIGYINVSSGDQNLNKPWSHILCGSGLNIMQSPHGQSVSQTANFANSIAPVSATLSNTAAGYTTLGGQYQFAATATNETDWALFVYQVPVGAAATNGKNMYVTSVTVSPMVVTGAATANATVFFWSCATNGAVSLATPDSVNVIGPRRVPLGVTAFPAAAAIGSVSQGFTYDFEDAPIFEPNGNYFIIALKQFNGAATSSLVFRGHVTITGYFE